MPDDLSVTTKRPGLPAALHDREQIAPADFDTFYREAYPRVVRSLAVAVGNVDDAAQAAQEAFARALRRWRTVRAAARPDAWVYVVATRYHYRTAGRRAGVVDEQDDRPHRDTVDTRMVVADALRRLTPRQRAMVVLRFHADLPVNDIAKAMGCAEGTVKATLHQALRAMRVQFEEEDLL